MVQKRKEDLGCDRKMRCRVGRRINEWLQEHPKDNTMVISINTGKKQGEVLVLEQSEITAEDLKEMTKKGILCEIDGDRKIVNIYEEVPRETDETDEEIKQILTGCGIKMIAQR